MNNALSLFQYQGFPVDALPPMIRDAVLEVFANIQAPLPLIVSSALGAISLACQNSVNVSRPYGLVSPCSLYVITIAESGERKTTVDSMLMQAIREFERSQLREYDAALIKYQTDLLTWEVQQKEILRLIKKAAKNQQAADTIQQRLADHQSKKPQKPRKVKLIYNDATPAAIKQGMAENSTSIGLISDEAGIVLNGRAMGELATINQLWHGTSLQVDRSEGSFSVDDPRLTLSLMVQPKVFQAYLEVKGEKARDIGLFARCLVAAPYSTQGTRFADNRTPSWEHLPKFQARITEILQQNIADIEQGAFTRQTLSFSWDAKDYWVRIYNDVESQIGLGGYLSDVKDYASKAAENVARVAALFHFFEGNQGDISRDSIDRACRVCDWYLREFKRLFSPPLQIPVEQVDAMLLDTWLWQNYWDRGCTWIKKNDLRQRAPNALRSKSRLDAALDTLLSQGKITYGNLGKTICVCKPNYFNLGGGQLNTRSNNLY